jgi:hypothetical protein
MNGLGFDGPAWPLGKEWPTEVLPAPCLTLEIAYLELEVLIAHHVEFAVVAKRDGRQAMELFHRTRASYLRQRLTAIAPHRLTPDRAGQA